MKVSITIGVLMLMLASGFVFLSYDRSDSDIKLMSDDDYIDADYSLTKQEIEEVERRTVQVISKKSLAEQREELNKIFKEVKE